MKTDYEDEIDLVDLLRILIKNKGLILLITIITTMISVGGVFYIKYNKIEKYQQDFKLIDFNNSYYAKRADLRIKSFVVENILLNDKVVNEFYKDEEFNKYFKSKTATVAIDDKRQFITNNIKLKKIMDGEKIKNYSLISSIKGNKELSRKLIGLYIGIINKEKMATIIEAVNDEYEFVIKKRDLYEKKVKLDEYKVAEIIKQQPNSILENQSLVSIISIINPSLLQEVNSNKALYKKYYNQMVGIEGILNNKKLDQQIEKLTSIYKIEEKSKSLMMVAVGLILGIFLGVFMTFIKEFLESNKFTSSLECKKNCYIK